MYVAFVSCNLLGLENGLTNFTFDIVIGMNALLLQSGLNYVICQRANNITDEASEIGEQLYHSPWYKMDETDQRAIGLIIRRAQIPFYYDGGKIIICNMQFYLTVCRSFSWFLLEGRSNTVFNLFRFQLIRSAMSYYAIFRQLANY